MKLHLISRKQLRQSSNTNKIRLLGLRLRPSLNRIQRLRLRACRRSFRSVKLSASFLKRKKAEARLRKESFLSRFRPFGSRRS